MMKVNWSLFDQPPFRGYTRAYIALNGRPLESYFVSGAPFQTL